MTAFTLGVLPDTYTRTIGTEDGPITCQIVVYLIGAYTREGRNFVLVDFTAEAEAEATTKLHEIEAARSNPETAPDAWFETEPTYGSPAWGAEDEYALACFEADAYGEPRPKWPR